MLGTNRYEDPGTHLPFATEPAFLNKHRIPLVQAGKPNRKADDSVSLDVHHAPLIHAYLSLPHGQGLELPRARIAKLVRRIGEALDRDKAREQVPSAPKRTNLGHSHPNGSTTDVQPFPCQRNGPPDIIGWQPHHEAAGLGKGERAVPQGRPANRMDTPAGSRVKRS